MSTCRILARTKELTELPGGIRVNPEAAPQEIEVFCEEHGVILHQYDQSGACPVGKVEDRLASRIESLEQRVRQLEASAPGQVSGTGITNG